MKSLYIFKYLVVALFLAHLGGCATAYSAKSIRATVVDAKSAQPVEGVVVVAHWVLSFGPEGGGGGDLMLMETVTNKRGEFSFPAWGPQPVPAGYPFDARLKGQDPEIILLRHGYRLRVLQNDTPTVERSMVGATVRTSDWDNKTATLEKFPGDENQYAESLSVVLTNIRYGGCNFKKIPRLLSAVIAAGDELKRRRIYSNLITLDELQELSEGRCGSVEEFLREYLKNELW